MLTASNTSRRKFIQTSSLAITTSLASKWVSGAENIRPLVRIGLVTDLHYADKPPAGTRHYKETATKLTEAVELFQQEKPDFVVELGDLVDAAPTVEEEIGYLKTISAILDQVDCPRHYVLGNHCVATLTKAQFYENCGAERRGYYSWDLNGVHFIVLDACYQKDLVDYEPGNFEWSDANLPPKEIAWLKDDLGSTTLPTVIFVHQRLDVEAETSPHAIKQSGEVRRLIEESGKVRAVFQGHSHQNELNEIGKTAYCTLAAMVEGAGAENNAYSILEVLEGGTLRLRGYRKQENRAFS